MIEGSSPSTFLELHVASAAGTVDSDAAEGETTRSGVLGGSLRA
jgi:hypothetical protein